MRILINFLLLIEIISYKIDYRKYRGNFPFIYRPIDPYEKMVHELELIKEDQLLLSEKIKINTTNLNKTIS